MNRRKIVAANWKMNLNLNEAEALVEQIMVGLPHPLNCEVVIAPPFVYIPILEPIVNGTSVHIAAQHCHFEHSGAFTGEISVSMLNSIGVQYVITGHSERRQVFFETNEVIKSKVNSILGAGMIPIFCCGEPLEIRNSGKQNEYVRQQLEESIFHLEAGTFSEVVIAYEPIWAIGTGVTASPEQVQEMHVFIRDTIASKYGVRVSDLTRILYGGSIKSDNAGTLFSQPDVDGGLVGGASLVASGFLEIIKAAC